METLRVGMMEKKYEGYRPRKLVSLPTPSPLPSSGSPRRLDCSPTREEDVTIDPAMTDLGKKRKKTRGKCKVKPGDGNKIQGATGYVSWRV